VPQPLNPQPSTLNPQPSAPPSQPSALSSEPRFIPAPSPPSPPPLSSARAVEAEAAAQWCPQSVGSHILFSGGFWRRLLLIQFDLVNAGILPVTVALRRLVDGWVRNEVRPYDLGLLPRRSRDTGRRPAHKAAGNSAAEPRAWRWSGWRTAWSSWAAGRRGRGETAERATRDLVMAEEED